MLITVKTAVLAPMPTASVNTATLVATFSVRSCRWTPMRSTAAAGDPLVRLAADRLVFQCQRHGQHQHERPTQGAVDQRCRRAGRAPQAGDDDVGVQHEPHPIRYHILLGELSRVERVRRCGTARRSEPNAYAFARIIGGCAPAEPLRLPESAQDHGEGSRTTGRGDRYLRSSGR